MGATDRFDSDPLLADGTPGDLADLAEIERYADTVAAFAEGTIPEDRFTAARLQQGCYGQRQPGVNMLRIKAPGGQLDRGPARRAGRRRGHLLAARMRTRTSPRANRSRSTPCRSPGPRTRCAGWRRPA